MRKLKNRLENRGHMIATRIIIKKILSQVIVAQKVTHDFNRCYCHDGQISCLLTKSRKNSFLIKVSKLLTHLCRQLSWTKLTRESWGYSPCAKKLWTQLLSVRSPLRKLIRTDAHWLPGQVSVFAVLKIFCIRQLEEYNPEKYTDQSLSIQIYYNSVYKVCFAKSYFSKLPGLKNNGIEGTLKQSHGSVLVLQSVFTYPTEESKK